MLMALISLILIILFLPLLCVLSLFVNPKKEYSDYHRFYRRILYLYTGWALNVVRVKVKTEGLEKLPQDSRFLLVSNHRSNYDPIITWHALKNYDLAFVSKASNFKIPVFGRIIRKCNFMAIDRKNPKNAIRTIEKASNLIKTDTASVAIYPEGTRNKKSKELLPFHNGVFKIAQKASAPIVVVGVDKTETVHARTPWKKTVVRLGVLTVIDKETVAASSTNELGERIKTALNDDLLPSA